ncbi:biliverdin-producing heme oxygenase [Algoriphagus aquimarinus]|uniref:Biliverdin-producing heme oxygenase n=1 Tax=Algoriphagus aquimarinus TaxID=237018 RepID=A0A5C7AGC7_9BACT|nr:biliverdin-producing heme oxygenase [Algoriphagus aquimarinus]TXE06949.1 biliverdin-producing heme oxygenase [Algoriphagus aquimarinus]
MTVPLLSSVFTQELRKSTAPLHEQLESLPVSQSILAPEVSIQEYLRYLDLMHDVIVDVETTLFPIVSTEINSLNERRKTSLLERDFEVLGFQKQKKRRLTAFSEQVNPIGFAMGVFYVIEGSSLGGRVIYKHIHKVLGLDTDSGAAYFSGYGELTGMLWKEFMTELITHEQKNHNGDEIIAGANHAFDVISKHFQGTLENS